MVPAPQGVDLREYARDIEEELKAVEMASIEDYIKEDDNLKTLHNDIGACKGILERMENMLGGFQTDLSQIRHGLASVTADCGRLAPTAPFTHWQRAARVWQTR